MSEPIQPFSFSTGIIQNSSSPLTDSWFEYPVRAQPHHTDYTGAVWHGAYLTWMEEARVECLRSLGIEYSNLVAIGCDLLVVEISLRYHRAIKMGMSALVKTRMANLNGVRLNWDYQIEASDRQELYLSGIVTLVAVDREKGKILRQLPPTVQDIFARLIQNK